MCPGIFCGTIYVAQGGLHEDKKSQRVVRVFNTLLDALDACFIYPILHVPKTTIQQRTRGTLSNRKQIMGRHGVRDRFVGRNAIATVARSVIHSFIQQHFK